MSWSPKMMKPVFESRQYKMPHSINICQAHACITEYMSCNRWLSTEEISQVETEKEKKNEKHTIVKEYGFEKGRKEKGKKCETKRSSLQESSHNKEAISF